MAAAQMKYLEVASTTQLYGRANSLETIAAAVTQANNQEISANAVELLGKLNEADGVPRRTP